MVVRIRMSSNPCRSVVAVTKTVVPEEIPYLITEGHEEHEDLIIFIRQR